MKEVKINEFIFKKLMDGVKNCTAKCDSRDWINCIKLVIKKDSVTMYALDGYRAGKTQIMQNNEDEFTCYFKPFNFKPLKAGVNDVVIIFDKNIVTITTITEFGKTSYDFLQPSESSFNIEQCFQDTQKDISHRFGVKSNYLIQALRNAESEAIIEIPSNNESPFLVENLSEEVVKNTQLILPVRIR